MEDRRVIGKAYLKIRQQKEKGIDLKNGGEKNGKQLSRVISLKGKSVLLRLSLQIYLGTL